MSVQEAWHDFQCVVCKQPGECDGDCDDPNDAAHVHYGECTDEFDG